MTEFLKQDSSKSDGRLTAQEQPASVAAMDPSLPTMYDWVKRTREDVLSHTETLPNEMYLREHPDFPYGSIRDLHAHMAYAYLWWVGRYGLNLEPFQQQVETELITDVAAMRKKFLEVDAVLEKAFETFDQLLKLRSLKELERIDLLQLQPPRNESASQLVHTAFLVFRQ